MHRIGIDEVGRGPIAGPVTVAAVALPAGTRLPRSLGPLRDSKQLSARAREAWAAWVRGTLPHAIARSSPGRIDVVGIVPCANACALRAYRKVVSTTGEGPVRLDGGLYLGSRQRQEAYQAVTASRSDEDFPEVALASIVAKVARDRMMARYHARYPAYAFDRNAGYGTRAHYEALERVGPCPLHRLTFLGALGSISL